MGRLSASAVKPGRVGDGDYWITRRHQRIGSPDGDRRGGKRARFPRQGRRRCICRLPARHRRTGIYAYVTLNANEEGAPEVRAGLIK